MTEDAVQDPKSALEASVEEWVDLYQDEEDSRGEALAQLVNFTLRVGLV